MKNPLNQKEILQQLSKEFDQEYWKRGQEYYREGLVKEVKQNKTNITALCKGNSLYRMNIDLPKKQMTCSCPCDFNCKHLAALLSWLKNNTPFSILDLDKELEQCSKEELKRRLKLLLEQHPDSYKYFQKPKEEETDQLIKKFWIPSEYTSSFFNEFDHLTDRIFTEQNFELAKKFLKRLIDMYDHDPDSSELDDALCTFLREIPKRLKHTKSQRQELRQVIEDYPFDDFL